MKYDRDTVKEWAGDSQWRAIRADYQRFREHGYSGWGSEGFWALAIYHAPAKGPPASKESAFATFANPAALLRKFG